MFALIISKHGGTVKIILSQLSEMFDVFELH